MGYGQLWGVRVAQVASEGRSIEHDDSVMKDFKTLVHSSSIRVVRTK